MPVLKCCYSPEEVSSIGRNKCPRCQSGIMQLRHNDTICSNPECHAFYPRFCICENPVLDHTSMCLIGRIGAHGYCKKCGKELSRDIEIPQKLSDAMAESWKHPEDW